jgi:hypothetical protein
VQESGPPHCAMRKGDCEPRSRHWRRRASRASGTEQEWRSESGSAGARSESLERDQARVVVTVLESERFAERVEEERLAGPRPFGVGSARLWGHGVQLRGSIASRSLRPFFQWPRPRGPLLSMTDSAVSRCWALRSRAREHILRTAFPSALVSRRPQRCRRGVSGGFSWCNSR